MKALTALACIPFGSYRRTIVYLQKKFDGLQLPCYAINWHGIVHAYTSINDLYTCQVSDVSLVKQASSSGLKLSQF